MPNRKRKCKYCGELFLGHSGVKIALSWFCSMEHGISFARDEGKKAIKRERKSRELKVKREAIENRKLDKQRLMELKPTSYWMKRAQREFNKYIRLRDSGLPCISCGAPPELIESKQGWKVGGAWDAGHYLSVGSHPNLRFEELNVHRQCKSCNGGAGNYSRKNWQTTQDYRDQLIKRIGLSSVEWLESNHEPKRYRKADYQAVEAKYKDKIKELERSA